MWIEVRRSSNTLQTKPFSTVDFELYRKLLQSKHDNHCALKVTHVAMYTGLHQQSSVAVARLDISLSTNSGIPRPRYLPEKPLIVKPNLGHSAVGKSSP